MDHEVPEEFQLGDWAAEPIPPEEPSGPELSATYLPYGDDRLWVGMPSSLDGKVNKIKRAPREKKPSNTSARRPAKERFATLKDRSKRRPRPTHGLARKTRSRRVTQPKPQLTKRLRAGVAAAVVIVPASAFALMSSGGAPSNIPVATSSPTSAQEFLVLDIEGLHADRVSPKRVSLVWDVPDSSATEVFVYTVYRDGKLLGEVSEPAYLDERIKPKTYYYYAITATGTAGTTATSLQLLVAVPSETGELPSEPPPAPPPAPPAPIPSPSPSPSPTPKASSSPKPSNSFDPSFSLPPPPSLSTSPTSSSPSPSPSPSPSDTTSPSPSPTDTTSPSPSPTDTTSPSPSPTDTTSPTPPPTI